MRINPYKIRLIIASVIFILCILAIIGIVYPIKIMDIQILPLLQRVFIDFSVIAVLLLTIIVVITIFFGRLYCSTLCPFGILQELMAFLRGKKENNSQGNFGFKYLIAGLTLGTIIGGSAVLIRYIEPYSIFGSAVSITLFGIIVFVLIFILVFFKNRFFCTNVCPVGAVLGLISKFSLNKIYIDDSCINCGLCSKNCPSGCINSQEKIVDNEICVKCLKCLSVCPKNAMKFGVQPVKFNPNRRNLLWSMGALAFVGAGYMAGLNFAKNIAQKVKDIILPAGAVNVNRMANKCLNCNLCINNCPNGILVKADDKYSAVHIDYEKGKHYCDYNCNKCSEVCPSGAIKKITLSEKQKIRIGMATINSDCIGCGICIQVCPTGAISWNDSEKATVDGIKCIGCGKCFAYCPNKSINIFAVKEQSVI